MISDLPQKTSIVWDAQDNDIPEPPVLIANYTGSECIGIIGPNGEVGIPYRMIPEVLRVIQKIQKEHK